MLRLAIDIGGTKIAIGLIDAQYRLLATQKISVATAGEPITVIAEAVLALCQRVGVAQTEIVSCGVGVPGTVSADGRTLIKAPNLALITHDFVANLELALGVPVTLMQDSRAAAWGEYLAGGGKGASALVCITLGTGIGTGIVLDGKIWHGALGNAGELGHLPVMEGGRICGCGKSGCLEKYAAGGGLDITARALLGEDATAHDLFCAAEQGNSTALQVLDEAVVMLGRALVAIVNLLSPDSILFSGGLSAQKKLYVDPLIAYVRTHCSAINKLPRMEIAALGEFSPLVGAALAPLAYQNS